MKTHLITFSMGFPQEKVSAPFEVLWMPSYERTEFKTPCKMLPENPTLEDIVSIPMVTNYIFIAKIKAESKVHVWLELLKYYPSCCEVIDCSSSKEDVADLTIQKLSAVPIFPEKEEEC